jgi:hypothetical protein
MISVMNLEIILIGYVLICVLNVVIRYENYLIFFFRNWIKWYSYECYIERVF